MPLVSTTEPVGVGVPATAIVTNNVWTVVMLNEAGVTVTVGVLTPAPLNAILCVV